jgi:hypothetical protein
MYYSGLEIFIMTFNRIFVIVFHLFIFIYLIRKYIAYQKYERKATTEIKGTKVDFVLPVILLIIDLTRVIGLSSLTGNMNGGIRAVILIYLLLELVFCILFLVKRHKMYKTYGEVIKIQAEARKRQKEQQKRQKEERQGKSVVDNKSQSYFDGGLFSLIGWKILGALITLFTLGICYPWALCMVYGWEMNHTVIEGKRLKFHGKAVSLFGHWLLWVFLTIITLGIYFFWLNIALKKWVVQNTTFEETENKVLTN